MVNMLRIQEDTERLSKRRNTLLNVNKRQKADEESVKDKESGRSNVGATKGYLDEQENIPAWISDLYRDFEDATQGNPFDADPFLV